MTGKTSRPGILYRLLQIITLLGGALFCITMTILLRQDVSSSTLLRGNVIALQYLSGLGSASALLSFVRPQGGRTVLRGYYWFFFVLVGFAAAVSVPEAFKGNPQVTFPMLAQYLAVLMALAFALKILKAPKVEEVELEI